MDLLPLVLLGAAAIITVTALAPKAGVEAPLLLMLLGVAVSFLPFVPAISVPPEWILGVIIPPLLYAASTSLPTLDVRRDFAVIGGMSIALTLVSALVLGLVFDAVVPGVGLAGGIALGAVVSPTDAVASTIVKRFGAPPRAVTVLEGEGLLNDATALLVFRTALGAMAAASVSAGGLALAFVWGIAGAAACGFAIGWLGLLARRRLDSSALTTAVSFVVPFAAYLLAEAVGVSGFVAVVVAGLITGHYSPAWLTPRDRMFEHSNWETATSLLEGAVFLLMGLHLFGFVMDVHHSEDGLWLAAGVAALAALVLLAVRVAYIAPMLARLRARTRRAQRLRDSAGSPRRRNDIDYFVTNPLGPGEGALMAWAGMRGVVTVAAAQSLPLAFPHRPFVILVAFCVSAGTLLLHGATLPLLIRRLGLAGKDEGINHDALDLRRLVELAGIAELDSGALARPGGGPYDDDLVARVRDAVLHIEAEDEFGLVETVERLGQYRELWLRTVRAQRETLLAARAEGSHDTRAIEEALQHLDAEYMWVEMTHDAWLEAH